MIDQKTVALAYDDVREWIEKLEVDQGGPVGTFAGKIELYHLDVTLGPTRAQQLSRVRRVGKVIETIEVADANETLECAPHFFLVDRAKSYAEDRGGSASQAFDEFVAVFTPPDAKEPTSSEWFVIDQDEGFRLRPSKIKKDDVLRFLFDRLEHQQDMERRWFEREREEDAARSSLRQSIAEVAKQMMPLLPALLKIPASAITSTSESAAPPDVERPITDVLESLFTSFEADQQRLAKLIEILQPTEVELIALLHAHVAARREARGAASVNLGGGVAS